MIHALGLALTGVTLLGLSILGGFLVLVIWNALVDAWDLGIPLLVSALEGRSFLALRRGLDDAGFREARTRIIASRARVYVLPDRIVIESQARAASLLHSDDSDQWTENGTRSTRPRYWDSILVHHPGAMAARRHAEGVRHG